MLVPWVVSCLYWHDPKTPEIGMLLGIELLMPWNKSVSIAKIWHVRKSVSQEVLHFAILRQQGWTNSFSTVDADMRSLLDIDKAGKLLGLTLEVYDRHTKRLLTSESFHNPATRGQRPYKRIIASRSR